MSCSPTVRCGVSEVIGSWNTMPTLAPRTRSSAAAGSPRISCPSSRALPAARPFAASSPKTPRNSWLLPAPDSPTTPRHSPRDTESVTSCTARSGPCGVSNVTLSPLRLSTGVAPGDSALAGIESIAQAIAEQIQTQQQQHQRYRRYQHHPGRRLHLLRAGEDEIAEARLWLLHSEAEERQEALEQDHLR